LPAGTRDHVEVSQGGGRMLEQLHTWRPGPTRPARSDWIFSGGSAELVYGPVRPTERQARVIHATAAGSPVTERIVRHSWESGFVLLM